MLLCLDAGNTRIKFGLHDGTAWRTRGALDLAASDDLPEQLPHAPSRIVACNVAGAEVGARLEKFAHSRGLPLSWLASTAQACGVSNGYDNPSQLGADRWAALIGARGLHAGSCVVVLAGTATTIDLLDADGTYRGGMILPGLSMMRMSLARGTADLPQARGCFVSLATNTDDAIVSGAIHATLGAIERTRALAGPEAACLMSGGAAAELAPRLAPPSRSVEHLVLEGLARYALGMPQ